MQACTAAGGAEVLTLEVLPQLLPIFTCSAAQRRAYGCSIPSPPSAETEPPHVEAASLPPPNAASSRTLTVQRRMREAMSLAAGSDTAMQSGAVHLLSLFPLSPAGCRLSENGTSKRQTSAV